MDNAATLRKLQNEGDGWTEKKRFYISKSPLSPETRFVSWETCVSEARAYVAAQKEKDENWDRYSFVFAHEMDVYGRNVKEIQLCVLIPEEGETKRNRED